MAKSIKNTFHKLEVTKSFELGETQTAGILKDILGQLAANTDSNLRIRINPGVILINSKTSLRDKFYIICMEEGINIIYCKTTWHDATQQVETKEREFTVSRLLRVLNNLEEIHWSV